jgi:transcriptional regulator with XRE-family HTH domain
MISPYVRRLRLAAELRTLRTQAKLTHEQLSKRSGQQKVQISRLENGHSTDQASVMKILEALGVDGERWTQIMTIAREAGEKGWWEPARQMGERQALFANLEAGATSIRQYQQTFLPGLLQTPEFVRARCESDAMLEPLTSSIDGVVEGNAGRQRMLRRPGGPTCEVIIDETAIRRLTAPPDVFKKQLYHLAQVVNADKNISLRVLPIKARIDGYTVPR